MWAPPTPAHLWESYCCMCSWLWRRAISPPGAPPALIRWRRSGEPCLVRMIGQVERFQIKNFGCRASQADGAAIEAGLLAKGLIAAGEREDADLVVLNTCTVTSTADDEVRQTVRRIHREHPQARILVTGCYAQRAPEELAALEGV